MEIQTRSGSVFGASLLISGTCMGGGMLGLPIVSGLGGFLPALVMSFLIWLCMFATGLLFLEATLDMPDGVNMSSMAEKYLGKWGRWIAAAAFLFIYYCLVVAYYSGGAPLVIDFASSALGWSLPPFVGYLFMALFFGGIVFLGTRICDRVNALLMVGFFVTFFALLVLGFPKVQLRNLERRDWSLMFVAAPIFFASFGYQNIIPSMASYLNRNPKLLRRALFWGTVTPFVIYAVWQYVAIGALSGDMLWVAYKRGDAVTESFHSMHASPWFGTVAYFFSFFAIVTSLIGVAVSMVDFLGDAMHISRQERVGMKRGLLCFLVFLPPMVFAYLYPGIFLAALGYAGGFGETILNALLPIWMVWVARYRMKLAETILLPGGRGVLFLLLVFTFYTIFLQILEVYHNLSTV